MIDILTARADNVVYVCGLGIAILAVVCLVLGKAINKWRESGGKYIDLFESANDVILFVDKNAKILDINQRASELTGYTRKELLNIDIPEDLVHPEDRERMHSIFNELITGKSQVYEVRWRAKDGHIIWFEGSSSARTSRTGKFLASRCILRNITERKQVEHELQCSENNYKRLEDNMSDIVWIMDQDTKLIHMNSSVTQILGYSVEESLNLTVKDILTPNSYQKMQQILDELREEIKGCKNPQWTRTIELEQIRKDGSTVWVEVKANLLCNAKGEPDGILGITRDINDRKLAEQAIRETEQKFRILAENAPDIVWQLDLTGIITYASPSVRAFGYEPEELIGHHFLDFIPAEAQDHLRLLFIKALQDHSRKHYETQLLRKDGTLVWLDISYNIVIINGEPVAIQGIARDLTQRKIYEEALQESEERYRVLFEDNPYPMWVYDIDSYKFLAVNNAAIRDYGYSYNDFMSMSIFDIRPPEDIDSLCESIMNFDPTQDRREVWHHKKKDGTIIYAEIIAKQLDFDGKNARLVIAQDVSERKRIEAYLHLQTSAINAASDQILITNNRGEIEFVNPALEQETGYTFEEILNKTPKIFASGKQDCNYYSTLWETISTGKTWHGEITNQRKDGSYYIEDMTITPVKNEADVIEHFIAIKRNITDKKMYEKRLNHLAHHDVLTGLPNRLLLSDKLVQRFALARRLNHSMAIMFLDLDRFKLVNDTLGHNIGDLLLKEVAIRLSANIRDTDIVARMGGDEFIVTIGELSSTRDIAVIAQKILKALSEPFVLNGHELSISASIGISIYPQDGVDVETLVKNADTAMYRAKEQGRNRYHLFTEALNTAVIERMTLEHNMRKALERNEFLVYYQPRVNIATGKTVGMEALVRWQHKELGLISPSQFIPLAEETGLIVPISNWVLREACKQNKAWQDAGLPPMEIAINISARLFQQESLLLSINRVLKETGLDPRYLELELTESTLMNNSEFTIETLHQIKAMGVRVSIDDFGTGYSSLSRLKRFPVDSLKIDRSFVKDITTNADDAAVATMVVAMARSLNLKVVAEGVETLEQLQFLKSLACDEMQGYFISRPVDAEEFTQFLRNELKNRTYSKNNAA